MSKDLPQIKKGFLAGLDVGGTKIQIADNLSSAIHPYKTADYPNIETLLEEYFNKVGARPECLAVGMAGPRNDETGEVKVLNAPWLSLNPNDAFEKYGIPFITANDMAVTVAGVLNETGVNLLELKSGTPANNGTKLIATISTGVGAAVAFWDKYSGRYLVLETEGGHIGFQPKNDEELAYFNFLHKKYTHASIELAMSGKHGIENLVDHALAQAWETDLGQAIKRARDENRPVGAVLLEFATEGSSDDQKLAAKVLHNLGNMVGSALRDLTVAYKATGGVYLTGSVSLGLGEYLASETDFVKRFIHGGAAHDSWLANIPINLVTDPDVAALGALAMAKENV